MQKSSRKSDIATQYMAAWHSQRPSFALMGEFSAGKSTLLNMLIGSPVLPTKVTVTKLPVIWMTFGTSTTCHGLTNDGQLHVLDSEKPDIDLWDQYLVVRMTFDAPMLRHCDVIDTPGISDPRLAAGSLNFIAEFVDFAIWCTAANQAWRQSEKAAWKSLPKRLRDDSILAVTRADQVASAGDVRKVVKRLTDETAGLFSEICPIASHHAIEATKVGQINDQKTWHASGAETLLTAIKSSISVARQACDARETVSVPQIAAIAAPLILRENIPVAQQDTDTTAVVAQGVPASVNAALSKVETPLTKNTVLAIIGQARDVFFRDTEISDVHAEVITACLSVNGSDSLDYARVLMQVEQEVEDFAKGAWCSLA